MIQETIPQGAEPPFTLTSIRELTRPAHATEDLNYTREDSKLLKDMSAELNQQVHRPTFRGLMVGFRYFSTASALGEADPELAMNDNVYENLQKWLTRSSNINF
jgi:hypothetical protein